MVTNSHTVIGTGVSSVTPGEVNVRVSGNNPTPDTFPGESSGTQVNLCNGDFHMTVDSIDSLSLANFVRNRSGQCDGTVASGADTISCTLNITPTSTLKAGSVVNTINSTKAAGTLSTSVINNQSPHL